jgi:6-pyruvoyl-tetrahydropterin synthase
MYAVEVRDHIMIAHSFRGEFFGPAQRVHGATFVVDVAFFRDKLTENNVVVDIGRAHEALKAILEPLNYRNLDDLDSFRGQQTTTEFLSKHIFDSLAEAARSGALGDGGEGVEKIRVTLHESPVARAWFEGPIG